MRVHAACLMLALLVAGCASTTHYATLHASSLPVTPDAPQLRCAYALGAITDARPEGDHAGQLGRHVFSLEEPVRMLSETLAPMGWSDVDASGTVRIDLRLLRYYMTQQHSAKIPVVVLEARPLQQAPFIVRSQASSINWNGTEKEAQAAIALALAQARERLVDGLNARCPTYRPHPTR